MKERERGEREEEDTKMNRYTYQAPLIIFGLGIHGFTVCNHGEGIRVNRKLLVLVQFLRNVTRP